MTARLGAAVAIAWAAIPLLANLIPLQLYNNADWFLGRLLG